jgi:hypothetical protein
MDQRDWELFDRQMRRSSPPRNDVITSLTVAAGFVAGLVLGGIMFAQGEVPTRFAQQETNAPTLFPYATRPTTRE